MKGIKLIAFFMFLFSGYFSAQSTYFRNYNGIPITTNLWGKELSMYENYSFKDLDSAGVDAVVISNTTPEVYTALRNNSTQFKLIPNQHFWSGRQGITFYAERGYSVWEAEGHPDFFMDLNNSEGVSYTDPDNITKGIKNNPEDDTPCYIITGPNNYSTLVQTLLRQNPITIM
ncbi:MAG: hypothetical protein V1773_03955 [bacterium]